MGFYAMFLEPDGDTILVTSPDFSELVTFGKNRDDALQHAGDALQEAIAARIASGQDVPPSLANPPDSDCVETTSAMEMEVVLYCLLKARNVASPELRTAMKLSYVEQLQRLQQLVPEGLESGISNRTKDDILMAARRALAARRT